MRTEFDRVTAERHGDVAVLVLDHHETLNAIGSAMIAGLRDALAWTAQSGCRALILTGAGRAFCSGANLSEGLDTQDGVAAAVRNRMENGYHPLLRALRDLPMPVVSAVNGAAVGIGMSFALMGDLVLAARSAYFQLGFARIGLVPDGGATWLLPRLVGLARARELSLLAEKLPAEQALAWGLINRVCDDTALLDAALEIAGRLAAGPTVALGAMRRMYWESPHSGYEHQLGVECEYQQRAGATTDFAEGIAAFLQKRPPQFKGQ